MGFSCPPFVAAGLAAAFLVSTFSSPALSAQSDGTPIRIQTAAKPGKWITGRAAGITADSIGIVPSRSLDTLRYARGELQRMDVSRGRRSNAGRFALIGAGAGLIVGAVYVATDPWEECDIAMIYCEVSAGAIMLSFTGVGAAAGALIGAFSHHEKWKAARLEPHASVGPRGVLHVGLGMTF